MKMQKFGKHQASLADHHSCEHNLMILILSTGNDLKNVDYGVPNHAPD